MELVDLIVVFLSCTAIGGLIALLILICKTDKKFTELEWECIYYYYRCERLERKLREIEDEKEKQKIKLKEKHEFWKDFLRNI